MIEKKEIAMCGNLLFYAKNAFFENIFKNIEKNSKNILKKIKKYSII